MSVSHISVIHKKITSLFNQLANINNLANILLALIIIFLVLDIYFTYQWVNAHRHNLAYENGSIVKETLSIDAPLHALSVAYLLNSGNQASEEISKEGMALTINALTFAEAASDLEIRALAKFALGNLYFDLSAISGDIAAGGSHQQAVAQIELAREAYKGALRLKPNMYDARFNLELLDRLSPEKRTQGWQAETDGVTLQPFKRNGTASMRDNTRRGLP